MNEAELLGLAQVDALDDLRSEVAAKDIKALLADADDLDRLSLALKLADVVARKAGDLAVEAAAQAALGRADHQQVRVVLAGAGHQRRRIAAAADRIGAVGEHGAHPLRIGPGRLGSFLRTAQLRRGDHLHRLGDLLRRLDRGDTVAEVF